MGDAAELWDSNDEQRWNAALDHYWELISTRLLDLELEMDRLGADAIASMTPESWQEWLREKYFRWKYTAPNRYKTTTAALDRMVERDGVDALDRIRQDLLSPASPRLGDRLRTAMHIKGLGAAGASGLLSLLFPETFGTVDQFVVLALAEVEDLPEREVVLAMKPESLVLSEAVLLTGILQRKASELNREFSSNAWTPRKVEMALWAVGRTPPARSGQRGGDTGAREQTGARRKQRGDVMAKLELGRCYSRREISDLLGGSMVSFLPRRDGRVVCGCFRPEPRWNPGAPREVVFGSGEHVMRDARLVSEQYEAIPVFLYRNNATWEYVGKYLCQGLETKPAVLRRAERANPARGAIAGVLYFRRVE